MQFKREFDEIFISTPLVTEGNLRGINSRNTEHDKNNENKLDEQGNKQTLGSNEAETKLFSGKSLDKVDLVTKPDAIKSYAYRPHDQHLEIGLIKGRRNGAASRPRIRNKWAGTVLDPLSPFGVGDGKFLQFRANGGHLNKRVPNTYRNNFLEYNMTGQDMSKMGIKGPFNAYLAEDTISKNESMKLPIYISMFAGTFGGTILVFWLGKMLLSAISKRKSSNRLKSGDTADGKSMSDVDPDGDLCLAESRSNNPSLLKIDYYISADNNSGSPLSDIDENEEDSDEDDVDNAINRFRSIFDVGTEDEEEGYDENTPLIQEGHKNTENSATAVTNSNSTASPTATNNDTSVSPTPTVNISYQKNVFS
ncbi:hypothetical protein MACK_003970 [Theileria orientalis]|uniref:Uncharacterized protein n=1 Tax=Theileria orientalis TaxID=68886 RepID=A0A976SJL6_THEOR|nr:hypothetical protein MACK_003970 [Theileria orientalis]